LSTTRLEVTYLRTTSLKPDPRNPRVHSDKQVRQIAQSIESFGFNVPLLIDDEQKVIAGHGRLLAARKLGWDTVPAIQLSHLTESQRMAFLIADNRLTENSSWDERMLGEQLKILSELELDLDLEAIGFEVPEIDLLIDGLNAVPDADPDDRLPDLSESATTVSGDLWQLGKHRVLCGSALVTDDYGRLMDGAKADLVISDPPCNVAIDGHATGLGKVRHREFGMASGEMSSVEFTGFLRKAMTAARDHSATGSLVGLNRRSIATTSPRLSCKERRRNAFSEFPQQKLNRLSPPECDRCLQVRSSWLGIFPIAQFERCDYF
jgi:ParB-like nuclease domain